MVRSLTLSRAARVVAAAAVTVALATAAAGCGGPGDGQDDASSFSAYIHEPSHLIPGNDQEAGGITVMAALFDGLVSFDHKKLVNNVASSITSKDQRVWTIELKPGRTFHNGEKVTSHSFVDAWNAVAYAPNAWANAYFFEKIEGYDKLNPPKGKPTAKRMSGLRTPDDHTIEVTLTEPFSQFPLTLAYTAFYPLPKVAFRDLKAYEQAPVGNGPYRMVGRWKHNESISVKRYPRYRGLHRPHVNGVTFRIYSNLNTAYSDISAGTLDVDTMIPPARLREAPKTFGDRYFTAPDSQFYYLGFPDYAKRYANPDLRHALSMAIDRRAISDAIYAGAYRPADSHISPIVAGYRKGACGSWCTYDPAAARKLLAKAGGWHGRMTLWYSSDSGLDAETQAVANQLKRNLGITDIALKQQPTAQYLDNLRQHAIDGPYRLNWFMDYPSPQNYLEPSYVTGGSSNRTGFSDKRFDTYIAQGDRASSMAAGVPYYQKADRVLAERMPTVPLFFGQLQVAYSEHVRNVEVDAVIGLHTWDVRTT